ncbi:uncharacterized protein LOC142975136 [Anticarsia gemmatalis]|uniref:uncharacterized protein LOC142975136 n=1 Tax=Anticarsia gemmatalis TaxID=129554 RepID=UPI003F770F73
MPRRMALSDHAAKTLIKEVKKRGCLWDPDDDRYNDRYHMARAWCEIADIVHMPEDCIRVKWKNMRDLFKKEMRKYGVVEAYNGKWRHFEALAFLNKTTATGNGSDNNDVSESNEENSCDPEPVTKQEYVDIENGETEQNEVEVYFDETYDDPLPEKRAKVSMDEDYDVMFLKSLAPYFKQLDPIRKLVVRSKMQDMLLNEIAAQASTTQYQLKKS